MFQTFTSPLLYEVDNATTSRRFPERMQTHPVFVRPPYMRKVSGPDVLTFADPKVARRPMNFCINAKTDWHQGGPANTLLKIQIELNTFEIHAFSL